MLDASVEAHLQLAQQDRSVVVRAFVSAEPARTLRWRLVTSSRTSGGTSEVAQSGTTQGGGAQPVGTVSVSPNSQGTVILTVFDGAEEIARDTVRIEDAATLVRQSEADGLP